MSVGGLGAARWLAAALVVLLYAALCARVVWGERRKRALAAREAQAFARVSAQQAGTNAEAGVGAGDAGGILIAYASQTGSAEQIARQTAHVLHGAGMALRVAPLGELTLADLAAVSTALFIVSTTGEGDAPDGAAGFVRRAMLALPARPATGPLSGLHHAVLALGDREFSQFAAFGRRVDAWLLEQGSKALFDRVEVDGLDAAALQRWQHELGRLTSIVDTVAWPDDVPQPWRLAARRLSNPGSEGWPVFHLELEPPHGVARGGWESGDLVRLRVPGPDTRSRDYSIASVPAEGRVHLLVRQDRRADATLGLASGWLTAQLELGATVPLTVIPHRNFRLGANAARPLILVGNGTGIAGLRSHLSARAGAGRSRNWLVFGERHAARDFHFGDEVRQWQANGTLERLDLAFSRDQPTKRYVQDALRAQAATLRAWIAEGAAIYVCGSLDGMAAGVHAALVEIVGEAGIESLADQGRYRRDVY